MKYTRESDATFFGLSVQDEAFENGADNVSTSSYAIEAAFAQDLGNGLAVFLGGAFEDADAGDSYIVNAYTTFETGAWLFAAEVNFGNSESGAFDLDDGAAVPVVVVGGGDDVDVLSGLLMANYAYNDTASVTGRVSYEEVSGTVGDGEVIKYTLAHNKALADNLGLITEVSFSDLDADVGDDEVLAFAVELLFTF